MFFNTVLQSETGNKRGNRGKEKDFEGIRLSVVTLNRSLKVKYRIT